MSWDSWCCNNTCHAFSGLLPQKLFFRQIHGKAFQFENGEWCVIWANAHNLESTRLQHRACSALADKSLVLGVCQQRRSLGTVLSWVTCVFDELRAQCAIARVTSVQSRKTGVDWSWGKRIKHEALHHQCRRMDWIKREHNCSITWQKRVSQTLSV